MLVRAAAEEGVSRTLAQPQGATRGQVTHRGERDYPAKPRPWRTPPGTGRLPVPGRRPQGQVPARRMPGEQRGLIADPVGADGVTDEGWKCVDSSGNVIEGAR